jgi:transcription initiation factor TFIID subunit 7
VHKTHDHANYHKAADVGQMLIVYEDERTMDEVENEKGYKVDGFPAYFHSGLTPPMSRVVQRRYLSRFEERDTKPLPPPKAEVAIVEREIQDLITKLTAGKGKQKRTGGEASSTKDKIIEEVEEEIVDYEPWMGEGGVFTMEDAKIHPQCWLSKSELDEIDEAKRSVEEDRRRKEQEAIRAAKEREEEEKQKQMAKAEKKKKRKDKKKKEREEEAAAGPAVEQEAGASIADHIIGEVDDVTHIAMEAINGVGGDEDFLLDDMFNFDDDDITEFL